MTKKHFQLVADTIAQITNASERKQLAEHNAKLFAKANPRFDEKRFLVACKVSA